MAEGDQASGPTDGREARESRLTGGRVGPEGPTGNGVGPEGPTGDGLGPHRPTGDRGGGPGEGTAPRDGRAPRGTRRRGVLRGFLALSLLAAVGLALLVAWGLSPVSSTTDRLEFEVLPGWGASRVSQELEERDVIRNAQLFSAYLRLRGLDRSVGEGIYDLDRAAGAAELAATLVRGGRPRVAQVVLPEGIRGVDLAQRLASATGVAGAQAYRELIENPGELRPPYVLPGATLEGYLFPASYEIPLTETPEQTIARLLERFDRELTIEVRERLGELGMSVHEWVTLASVVQAEAGSDEEMPLIAGVFLNRLELGMALQSDPTVAFGLGKRLPELDASAGDIRRDHPWNTYTRPGLPRGPISNPGRAALHSLFAPVRVDERGVEYLYFLHGSAGGEPVLRLNTGLEGHNQDVARYLRGQ
jgi:UPF0755 protein